MKRKTQYSKYMILSVVFAIVCLVFVARLINLQFNRQKTEDLRAQSDVSTRTEVIQALRGNICDRNGKVLVTSSYSYDIIFNYDTMPDDSEEFNRTILSVIAAMRDTQNSDKRSADLYPFVNEYPSLAYSNEALTDGTSVKSSLDRILKRIDLEGGGASELVGYIVKRNELDAKAQDGTPLYSNEEISLLIRVLYDMMRVQFSSVQPYCIATGVDVSFVTYVKELSLSGVKDKISSKRTYLYPGYASHILGRVGAITAETWEEYKALGYDINATVGIDGCEAAFEEYLRGKDGVLTIKVNASGEIVDQYVSVEPVAGKDVWLTIDIDAQIAAEDALAEYMESSGKKKGASVALDPNTGDILALASYPTFDLTTFSKNYASLAADKNSPLLNRATYASYTPGSTFKIAVALAGLEKSAINRNSTIYCDHGYRLHGFSINCENHASSISHLNVIDAIKYSCNAFFIGLGYDRLDIDTMTDYCTRLGLGQATGIEIPELTGQVACPDNALNWTQYEEASSYIGQSIHKYTPLQLSSYIATVANGGTRYAAHLLHSVHSFSGELIYKYERIVLDSVEISSSTLSTIKEGMKEMVNGSGSASYYMYDVEKIPYTVCGKSGTAQIGGGKQNCWFVAFAPMSTPEIVVSSIVEEGTSGASVSQIDAAVIGAYLNK